MVSFPLESRRGKKQKKQGRPQGNVPPASVEGTVRHALPEGKIFAEGSIDRLEPADSVKEITFNFNIPPALAFQHQDMDEIRLTPLAHEINIPALWELTSQIDQFKEMTIPHDRLALSLSLFILSNRNGPDVAKRMHALELNGCEFQWTDRPLTEKGVPESDLHIKCGGSQFLVGARGTKTWQAGVEFRLGLHRKEAQVASI